MKEFIVDPFAIVPSLKKKNEAVNERAGVADQFLTDFIDTADKIQEQRKAALEKTVEAKQAVNETVQKTTENFAKSVTPLFQKRQAVVDRKVALQEMNPIKREIFGIFNRNYNPKHLDALDQGITEQLQVRGQEFQQLMGIQDTIVKGIESSYNDHDAINQLELANGEQDVQLRMQGVGSAQQVFRAELGGLEAQSEAMVAQARARQDLLSGMTHSEINNALAQANQKGGEVMINGVPLRAGELKEAAMSWQDKELALESRNLAVQAGRMDLADRHEQRMISQMTAPELQAAIANGGVYRGQKLNQEQLTRSYASMTQRQQIVAANASTESAIPIAHAMIRTIGNNTNAGNARAQGLLGQVPREMQNQALSIATRIKGFAEAERKARESGASAEFVATQLPMFQGILKEQEALWDKMADRWAGGNKDLKAVGLAWMSGSPLNSESAAKGLITLARSGIPAGTKLSGPAKAAFEQAQRIVAAHDKGDPNKPINLLMQGAKKSNAMDPDLIRQVSQAMSSQYVNNSMKNVLSATPQLAATITGADGQPHPFSRVRPDDFHTAMAVGDSTGYKLLGQKLGLNEEQTRTIFAPGGTTSDAFQKVKGKNPDLNLGELKRQLVATQTQAMLNALDHTPSATNGFKPSQAFVSLLSNPEFQTKATNAVQGQGQSSAGDYMISSIGGVNFESSLYGYGQVVQRGYSQLQANATQQAIEASAKLRNASPWDAASMTLGTMDGINHQESQALMQAVKKIVASKGITETGFGPTANAQIADQIDTIITKTKFQDPNLEKVRQTAARDWAPRRQQIYRGLTGFLRAIDDAPNSNVPAAVGQPSDMAF